MTNKTKKMLSILASTVVLAGFTADITLNSNPTTVNAAKHHKKKAKKHHKKAAKQTATSGTTPKSNYSSLGAWYLANDKYLYGRYNSSGYFANAINDSNSNYIDASKVNNEYYKEGWIIAYANPQTNTPSDSELYGVNADTYNKAISIYNAGASFINSSSGIKAAVYNRDNNLWSVNNSLVS